jgi:uncharacterized protein YndB with AHSA1/START domain
MENPKFVYVTHINATPEELWSALTQPEFTQQYWGGNRIQSDWTTGASVKLIKPDGGIDLNGEVLQAEPPQVLSYTFQCGAKAGEELEPITKVTFQITTSYGVTKLTVIHDGFEPGSKAFLQVSNGWQAILSSLKTLLETGTALPFTYRC